MRRARVLLLPLLFSVLPLLSTVAPAAAITLNAPNGESYVTSGSSYVIRWSDIGNSDAFNLAYSVDGGRHWKKIASRLSGTEYTWNVPVVARNQLKCLVRVQGYRSGVFEGQDRSDRKFAILATRIAEPNGDETYMPGQVVKVTWKTFITQKPVAFVRLSYTLDRGNSWRPMGKKIRGNPGSYDWAIPISLAGKYPGCKVRVVLLDSFARSLAVDVSDAYFSIGMVSVNERTTVLDAESIGKLKSYDAALNELRFNGWTPLVQGLVPGNVLVVGSVPAVVPAGLLGMVVGLREEGGEVIVSLGEASLDLVFRQGTASLFHTMDPSEPLAELKLEPGVKLVPETSAAAAVPENFQAAQAAGFGGSKTYTFEVDKEVENTGGSCAYHARISGKITIGIDFDISAKVDLFGLKKFALDTRPFVASSITVAADAGCAKREEWMLAELRATPITIQVGPVPVVFVPQLGILAGYEAEAKVTVTLAAQETLQAATGMSYVRGRDPELKYYWEPSSEFSLTSAASLNGHVKGYVSPFAGVYLYGVAGSGFGVEGYVQLRGSVDLVNNSTDLGVYAGLIPQLVFDIHLFGFRKTKTFDLGTVEWLLWPTAPPSPVTSLTASAGTFDDRIALSWVGTSDATIYMILRKKVNAPGDYVPLGVVDGQRFDDFNAVPDFDYCYGVIGINRNGTSPSSNPASGWMKIKPPTVEVSKGSYPDKITVAWRPAEGAGKYAVYRSPYSGSSSWTGSPAWTLLATLTGMPPAPFEDQHLPNTKDHYYYKVEATGKGDHQSTRSNVERGNYYDFEGWMSPNDPHPEGSWLVKIGSCSDSSQWKDEWWSFSRGTLTTRGNVIIPAGIFPFDFTCGAGSCNVGWTVPGFPGRKSSGTSDDGTALTIIGRDVPNPIYAGEQQCWTATRRPPDMGNWYSLLLSTTYSTALPTTTTFELSWDRLPGAGKYEIQMYYQGSWTSVGFFPQPVEPGRVRATYTVLGRKTLSLNDIRIRAENAAGKGPWWYPEIPA